MHNRERGAAHINIYFFLVVLVLFLASLYFGYVQMSQVNGALQAEVEAKKAKTVADRDLQHYKHYVEEISDIIGKKGTWAGRAGFNWTERYNNEAPAALQNVAVPADVKKALEDLAVALKMPTTESSPIGPFFGKIDSLYRADQQAVTEARALATQSQADLATAQRGFQTANSKATADQNTANAAFQRQIGDLRTANAGLQNNLTQARDAERTANEAKQKDAEAHQREIAKMQKEIDRQKGQNSALVATLKLRNPPDEHDGRVISGNMRVRSAWVDIGKKDMLTKGTMFRITDPTEQRVKGYGRVVKLEQDKAELLLTDVADAIGDPISRGDKLFNDLYSPKLKRKVAMIGRFSHPYTKPMIKTLLEKHGNTVFDNVQVGVDLVVVGLQAADEEGNLAPVESLPGYKTAQELGCEIITIQKIRDLLELSDS